MARSQGIDERAGLPRKGSYHGWRVVAALFMCTLSLFGVSIYSFIILAQPLGAEFGWSPAEIGGAVSAMWLTAPIALLSGPLLKRWNAWTIIYAGLLIQVAALLLLPMITQIEMLYLLRIAMGVGKVALITAVPIVVTTWFSRRFATAMAIIWAGGAAGGFILSPITEELSQEVGWRTAATAIACGLLLLICLIGFLARGPSSPSEIGMGPGGAEKLKHSDQLVEAPELSIRETLRQIDWLTALPMVVSVVGIGMASIAVLTQLQSVLTEVGISSSDAASFLGLTAIGSLVGSASIGWLLDRARAVWGGLLTAATIYVGLFLITIMGAGETAILALVASFSCGYAFGAGEVLWITLTKRQFGTAVFATTYGGWYFALQIGYAAGGGIAGWGFASFGTAGFLALVALMYLPAAVSSLTLRGARLPPERS